MEKLKPLDYIEMTREELISWLCESLQDAWPGLPCICSASSQLVYTKTDLEKFENLFDVIEYVLAEMAKENKTA